MADKHIYLCGCGAVITREIAMSGAVCFDCKVERRRIVARISMVNRKEMLTHDLERLKELRKVIADAREQKRRQSYERDFKIIEMRLENMTLEQIGASFTPQITRERVRQIIKKIVDDSGIELDIDSRKTKLPPVITTCKVCGEELVREVYVFKGHGKHRHVNCQGSKYINPDGSKMSSKEKARYIYYNNPARKQSIKTSTAKWSNKKYKTDPAWREKQIKYRAEWTKKKMQDPVWAEKFKQKQRENHARKMQDPEYRDKLKARYREKNAKKKASLSPWVVLPPSGT